MARETFDSWIPVQYAPDAIVRPNILSAIENTVPATPMASESKLYPRSGAASVTATPKGNAFTEDAGTNDKVQLNAVKFATAFRVANEDIDDSIVDLINIKKDEFVRAYAITFDNACLGTTPAANLGSVPFNSLYNALRTADAGTGYVVDANYTSVVGGLAGVTYGALSGLLTLAEASDWYDPNSQVIVAHPALKAVMRNLVDGQGRPIFVAGLAGTPDTLFGHDIKWSLGAKTSAAATRSPSGNPLVFSVNPAMLMNGTRKDISAIVDKSASVLTDESLLVMQARKAFAVSVAQAHAVLEIKP